MRTRKVIVLPYDEAWKATFIDIKNEIESAIGNLIIGVEHFGSTSVEGMSAKPCIDVDVIIKDYTVFDAVVDKLASIGYIHEGDLGIDGREAFKYMDKPHLMTHHLYVCPQNSEELLNFTYIRPPERFFTAFESRLYSPQSKNGTPIGVPSCFGGERGIRS